MAKKSPRLLKRGDVVRIKIGLDEHYTEQVIGQVSMALVVSGGVTVLLDPDTEVEVVQP